MLSFETKVWFTTILPETPAFSAATTNLSFSPRVCCPPSTLLYSPCSISPSFFSIAPHYFAPSLSPPTPLWCFCPSPSLIAAERWLSQLRHPFNVWWPIFHSVEECVYFGVGVTEGSGSRRGRREEARAPTFCVCACVFVCLPFGVQCEYWGKQITIRLDPMSY